MEERLAQTVRNSRSGDIDGIGHDLGFNGLKQWLSVLRTHRNKIASGAEFVHTGDLIPGERKSEKTRPDEVGRYFRSIGCDNAHFLMTGFSGGMWHSFLYKVVLLSQATRCDSALRLVICLWVVS